MIGRVGSWSYAWRAMNNSCRVSMIRMVGNSFFFHFREDLCFLAQFLHVKSWVVYFAKYASSMFRRLAARHTVIPYRSQLIRRNYYTFLQSLMVGNSFFLHFCEDLCFLAPFLHEKSWVVYFAKYASLMFIRLAVRLYHTEANWYAEIIISSVQSCITCRSQ